VHENFCALKNSNTAVMRNLEAIFYESQKMENDSKLGTKLIKLCDFLLETSLSLDPFPIALQTSQLCTMEGFGITF
jgi:hypothetical protein